MFLLEPEFVIFALLTGLIIFGPICAIIGKKRQVGATAGFFWGFLLGIIGLVIVLCSNKIDEVPYNYTTESIPDQLMKYKKLLDDGAITQAEYQYQKSKLLNQ